MIRSRSDSDIRDAVTGRVWGQIPEHPERQPRLPAVGAYTRYSDETKAAAINLYAELRGAHQSRQATDRAVAAQPGIRDLGNIKKWHRERGVDRW